MRNLLRLDSDGIMTCLLPAKSVFRFGDLNRTKDIKVAEYVLIGTFVSFTIAIVIGFSVIWLICSGY